MDLQDRFAIPLLGFTFLANLIFCLQNIQNLRFNSVIILFAVATISVCLNTYNIYFKVRQFQDIETQSVNIEKALCNPEKTEIVFWDFYLWNVLNNKIASDYPLYCPQRDYSIDFPFGFALDAYKDRMKKQFNTWDFYGVINQSVDNKKMVYFTTEENLTIIINYINLQYKRNIRIHKQEARPAFINKLLSPELNYYLFYLSED